jgi:hypothetical protein
MQQQDEKVTYCPLPVGGGKNFKRSVTKKFRTTNQEIGSSP